jgi:hypothetical protein
LELYPVGGTGVRSDAAWDAMVDTGSGVSTRTTAAQTTKTSARWVWDVAISPNSGVCLAHAVSTNAPLIERGYYILRAGTGLVVKHYTSGTAVDVSASGVFASATGIVRCIIEAHYDATSDELRVYVDGTLQATVPTPAYTFYMAGLVAGATGQYSAGIASVGLGASNEAV